MKNGRTLLLVDDDQDDLDFFREAIDGSFDNIKCFPFTDPEFAIRQLSGDDINPDLIFLDLNMPKMNGRQCLAAIRSLPQYVKTPVIIYSTSAEKRDFEETRSLGASYFLTKPTQLHELRQQLGKILSMDWTKA